MDLDRVGEGGGYYGNHLERLIKVCLNHMHRICMVIF